MTTVFFLLLALFLTLRLTYWTEGEKLSFATYAKWMAALFFSFYLGQYLASLIP